MEKETQQKRKEKKNTVPSMLTGNRLYISIWFHFGDDQSFSEAIKIPSVFFFPVWLSINHVLILLQYVDLSLCCCCVERDVLVVYLGGIDTIADYRANKEKNQERARERESESIISGGDKLFSFMFTACSPECCEII